MCQCQIQQTIISKRKSLSFPLVSFFFSLSCNYILIIVCVMSFYLSSISPFSFFLFCAFFLCVSLTNKLINLSCHQNEQSREKLFRIKQFLKLFRTFSQQCLWIAEIVGGTFIDGFHAWTFDQILSFFSFSVVPEIYRDLDRVLENNFRLKSKNFRSDYPSLQSQISQQWMSEH